MRGGMRRAALCALTATVLGWSAAPGAAGLPPIVESQPLPPRSAAPAQEAGASSAAQPSRARTIEERVARLERLLEGQALVDMLTRLEDLQREVQALRGQTEVQAHAVQGIEQRQRELYLDIDRRIRQLEVQLAGMQRPPAPVQPATPPGPGATAGTGPALPAPAGPPAAPDGLAGAATTGDAAAAASAPVVDPLAEQTAYRKAFDILKAGRYQESVAAFRNFLARYPDGAYSANAQYWLGEANYVMKRFPMAIEEFQKVLKLYPDSSKVPDAMLKIGYSYYELEDWEQARKTLNRLVEQYPGSTAAQLAQNRLHRMRLEGR